MRVIYRLARQINMILLPRRHDSGSSMEARLANELQPVTA